MLDELKLLTIWSPQWTSPAHSIRPWFWMCRLLYRIDTHVLKIPSFRIQASATRSTFSFWGYIAIGWIQRRRLEQLLPFGVGWTDHVWGMSVSKVFEMMDFVRLEEHGYS